MNQFKNSNMVFREISLRGRKYNFLHLLRKLLVRNNIIRKKQSQNDLMFYRSLFILEN